ARWLKRVSGVDQLSESALFASGPVPAKFLQQNVFRWVHEQRAIADLYRLAPGELLRVEGRAAGDGDGHLGLSRLMNQVRTAPRANRSTHTFGIDVEVRGERGNQRVNVSLVDCRDDINVERRARLPGK